MELKEFWERGLILLKKSINYNLRKLKYKAA